MKYMILLLFSTIVTLFSSELTPLFIPDPPEAVRKTDGSFRLRLFFPDMPVNAGINNFVRTEPPIALFASSPRYNYMRWENQMQSHWILDLHADFKPNTTYTVHLLSGLKTESSVLKENKTYEIKVPKRHPSLRFQSKMPYLSSLDSHVNIELVHVPRVKVRIERILDQNLRYFLNFDNAESEDFSRYSDVLAEQIFTIPHTTDNSNWITQSIQFSNLLTLRPSGLLKISVSALPEDFSDTDLDSEYSWSEPALPQDQKLVFVSDVGITARRTPKELLLQTFSLSSGLPLTGADVTVYSKSNAIVSHSQTNSKGLIKLPVEHSVKLASVVAKFGQEENHLQLGQLSTGPRDSLKAVLLLDRELYRSSDTVKLYGVVKDADLISLVDTPLRLNISSPSGKQILEIPITCNQNGLFEHSLDILPQMPLGQYQIKVFLGQRLLGSKSFRVEDFLPPRMEVQVEPLQPVYVAGDSLTVRSLSNWMFGAPVHGNTIKIRLAAFPKNPDFLGYEGFQFLPYYAEDFKHQDVLKLEDSGVTLEDGSQVSNLLLPSHFKHQGPFSGTAFVSLVDEGREVTKTTNFTLVTQPIVLGLKTQRVTESSSGTVVDLETARFSVTSNQTETSEIRLQLKKLVWHVGIRDGIREWYQEVVLVNEVPLMAPSKHTITLPSSGRYLIEAIDVKTGFRTHQLVWASGFDNDGIDPATESAKLSLSSSLVQNELFLDILSPITGELFLSLETDSILWTHLASLKHKQSRFAIPAILNANAAPRLFARVIRNTATAQPMLPFFAEGELELPREGIHKESPLTIVGLDSSSTMEPFFVVDILSSAPDGSEVIVDLVDEAILQLGQTQPIRLYESFVHFRFPANPGFHFMDQIDDKRTLGHILEFGGDSPVEEALSRHVPPEMGRRVLPFALRKRVILQQGKAQALLPLRQHKGFNGKAKLTAYLVGKETIGQAEQTVRFSDPVNVNPAWPRFLRSGDRLEFNLSLHSTLPETASLSLHFESTGINLFNLPPLVQLRPGEEAKIPLQIHSQNPGSYSATLSLKLPDSRRIEREVHLKVLNSAQPVSVATRFLLTGTHKIEPPKDFQKITGANINILNNRLEQLRSNSGFLAQYPYDCLEQVSARVFGILYHLPDDIKASHLKPSLERLKRLQRLDGAFLAWESQRELSRYEGIVALDAILTARNQGYPVDSKLLKNAVTELGRYLKSLDLKTLEQDGDMIWYAAWVLAEAEELSLVQLQWLNSNTNEKFSPISRGFQAVTNQKFALNVNRSWLNQDIRTSKGNAYQSPIQKRAQKLFLARLLVDTPQSVIQKLEEELLSEASTRTLNTHEAMWISRSIPKSTIGTVAVTLKSKDKTLSLSQTGEWDIAYPDQDIEIQNHNVSSLEAQITYHGAREEKPGAQINGIESKVAWINSSGSELSPITTVKVGDRILIQYTLEAGLEQQNILVSMPLPSCMEFPLSNALQSLKPEGKETGVTPDHEEFRDERYLAFYTLPKGQKTVRLIPLSVVAKGTCMVPALTMENLYFTSKRSSFRAFTSLEVQ